METVEINDKETESVKLSPAAFLPGAAFTFANNTGIKIKVSVDRRTVVVEAAD